MESTAQYWKPVWQALEPQCHLELAQAQSNRGPRGRKSDFADAERLVGRYLAGELILSFVPDPQQRLWRALWRTKQTLTRDRTRLQNRVEGLLEEMRLKLSSVVSDWLGVSARRMLTALAEGETDPAKRAAMAEAELRATPPQLCDALSAAPSIHPRYRHLLRQYLGRIQIQERHASRRVPLGRPTVLLGGNLYGTGGIGGRIQERPLAQRQPAHAPPSQPGGECGD